MQASLYTIPDCQFCDKTKIWLVKKKIDFTEINVRDDPSAAARMIAESGQMGVPVLKIDQGEKITTVIGYDLKALREAFNY